MSNFIVINGNNIDVLKSYPDNYFDSIVTDPPYGLGKEPDAVELMKDWVDKGYHEISGSGFMGKEWDAFVPQPLFWKEIFRVLKHGGHILAFFGTRTYDWGVMAMRFAGFEVRDCIQWLYGSGFPKSHNISKAIDKMYGAEREMGDLKFKGGTQLGVINDDNWKPKDVYETFSATEEAKLWDGWGSALKPANEPIVLARKPLEKGLSIAENVLKWGTGGINIDGCRIGYSKDDHLMKYEGYQNGTYKSEYEEGTSYKYGNQVQINPTGRFPANIILAHHPECECKGEDWNCHPDCPIKILDEQSGILKSGQLKSESYTKERDNNSIFAGGGNFIHKGYSADKGGASRFFYVAKASKSERNRGLDGFEQKQSKKFDGGEFNSASTNANERTNQNFHPTVKPVKLMQYLVRLITPPNGKVLDPFCGSGTTGIACKLEGFEFVGIEQDAEYCKIAEARISNYSEKPENSKEPEKGPEKADFGGQMELF